MLGPLKFVNLCKFHIGNNRLCVLSLKAQIMVGIKGFNSHKFSGKNFIPRGLATPTVRLLEVITVGYILLG